MPRKRPGAERVVDDEEAIRVAAALTSYREFLRQPGRWLYIPWIDFPCCDPDPVGARDELQFALETLPPRSRAELRRKLAALDAEFLRRTLPNPGPYTPYSDHPQAWWRRRLTERA
jgi:hypothetical protein